MLRLKKEQYHQIFAKWLWERVFGVATHAIGDAAIEFVIDVYKELNKNFPNNIKRIEHLGLPEEKTFN